MKIGFTGTRQGMSDGQREQFLDVILKFKPIEFHHGKCDGCDQQAGQMVFKHLPSCKIILHPPTDRKYEADCSAHEIRERKPYLVRDHDIVDETDLLIAIPKADFEELRSGTWATVRYARKKHKTILLLYPRQPQKIEKTSLDDIEDSRKKLQF